MRYEGFTTLFVDGEGNELDYILVGKYEGSGSASKVFSKSGATVLVNITCDSFRNGCKANGDGYQQYDFLIDLIIKELWLVEMKTTNSQAARYLIFERAVGVRCDFRVKFRYLDKYITRRVRYFLHIAIRIATVKVARNIGCADRYVT